MASYSATLFVAQKASFALCFSFILCSPFIIIPIPAPEEPDASFVHMFQCSLILSFLLGTRVSSAKKSMSTCVFNAVVGIYLILYTPKLTEHIANHPDVSGMCKIFLSK